MARRRVGLRSLYRRQNSMPFWARIPWVCNGCLTARILVTRSATSSNACSQARNVPMIRPFTHEQTPLVIEGAPAPIEGIIPTYRMG